jgi:peroxiredoxin
MKMNTSTDCRPAQKHESRLELPFFPAILAVLVIASWAILATQVVAAEPSPELQRETIGQVVDDFRLEDYRGRAHALEEYASNRVVILAFIGCECPLVKLNTVRLQELSQQWKDQGVVVLGIDSNTHDSLTEIAAFARRHELTFPILKDAGNRLADAVLAQRTPEVVVLDADRKIQYRGRIDDQYGVGYIRHEAKNEFLVDAVEALLAGRPIDPTFVEPVGCHIGRTREPDESAAVTYHRDIAPILRRRCVECHRSGEIAPFELLEYKEVAGWADMIEEVVDQGRMPPWHAAPGDIPFANDRAMSVKEKQAIYDWVAAGAPEGEKVEAKWKSEWSEGWQLSREPDYAAKVTSRSVRVRATGAVRYQYFSVDPDFTEDKWVSEIELRPGNRAVVHHILMFAGSRGDIDRKFGGGARSFDGGYVPGQLAMKFPPGYAKKIKAGSQLYFQIHYTPIGTEQFDQSRVGMVFADPAEVKYQVRTASAVNPRFRIPAGEAAYEVKATGSRLPANAELLLMSPHMHLRGKSFYYEARLPDGTKKTLLNVPNYDFNWQTAYRLTEPLSLPAGTQIYCEAVYDNSEDNLNNPDSKRSVRWGEQTWDEMMIGYYDYAVPFRPDGADKNNPLPEVSDRVRTLFERLDKNNDGNLLSTELEARYRPFFARFDIDGDGKVSLAEFAKRSGR